MKLLAKAYLFSQAQNQAKSSLKAVRLASSDRKKELAMLGQSLLSLITLIMLASFSCKNVHPEKNLEEDRLSSTGAEQNQTGAESQLECQYHVIPTSQSPDTIIRCLVHSSSSQQKAVEWMLDRPDLQEPVLKKSRSAANMEFTIRTGKQDETLDISKRSMFKVLLASGAEISALGRHLLAAKPNSYHLGARCQNGFSLLITDENSSSFYIELGNFPSCQKLAKALHQKVIYKTDDMIKPIPEPGPTVAVSCKNSELSLTINHAKNTQTQSITPIDEGACWQLARLIHELKI